MSTKGFDIIPLDLIHVEGILSLGNTILTFYYYFVLFCFHLTAHFTFSDDQKRLILHPSGI